MNNAHPSLLMVGHMYATAFNRRKLNPLADYFDITCVTWPLEGATLLGRPLADFEQEDHTPRYELLRLPAWPSTKSITRYLHRGLIDLLRRRRFDVIFVDSEPWGLIRWQVWMLARFIQPHARLGEFSWENIERPGLKGRVLSLVYRLAMRTHDFSISGNQACRSIFIRYGAKPHTNLVAAQLGVESVEFRPADAAEKRALRRELGLPEPCGMLIGFCGRFIPEKGLRELLAAVTALREKHPARDLHLAMLGHGDLNAELAAFAEKNPWLHLLKPRPHREVAAFMRSLDLFVLPSKPVHSGPGLWEEPRACPRSVLHPVPFPKSSRCPRPSSRTATPPRSRRRWTAGSPMTPRAINSPPRSSSARSKTTRTRLSRAPGRSFSSASSPTDSKP
jgi:glycosyltransferase involved in cell wall biosynthesis